MKEQKTVPDLEKALGRLARRYSIVRMTPDRTVELEHFLPLAYRDQPIPAFRDPAQLLAHWGWVTRQHPSGPEGPQGWLCLKGGRIVGYFGMSPALAQIQGQERAVYWGRDLIVAPEERSAGAGPLLIKAAVAGCGKPFLIAGLNEAVYSIYCRMGFTDLGRIPLYIKTHDPRRFAQSLPGPGWGKQAAAVGLRVAGVFRRLSAPRGPAGVTFETLQQFDERFDRWWKEVERAFTCVIRRDSALMNWRYFGHPRHRYSAIAAVEGSRWKGVVVVRHGRSRGLPAGFITELLADPGDPRILLGLLREAEGLLLRSAPEPPVLSRCAMQCPRLERALVRSGFFRVPSPLHFMMAFAGESDSLRPFAQREDWMLNGGDSDLDAV